MAVNVMADITGCTRAINRDSYQAGLKMSLGMISIIILTVQMILGEHPKHVFQLNINLSLILSLCLSPNLSLRLSLCLSLGISLESYWSWSTFWS